MGQENECSADVGVVATSADEQEDDDTLVAQVHENSTRAAAYLLLRASLSAARRLFLFLSPFPRRGTLLRQSFHFASARHEEVASLSLSFPLRAARPRTRTLQSRVNAAGNRAVGII